MNREEEIQLAARAQEILDNPAYQQLISNWETALLEKTMTYCQDETALKEIGHHVKAMVDFTSSIQEMVDTGKLATLQLAREEDRE